MSKMKYPLTVKPLKFHDNETGKPIGEEYWVLDANDEEIACMDELDDALRIAACLNACKDIATSELEKGVVSAESELHRKLSNLNANRGGYSDGERGFEDYMEWKKELIKVTFKELEEHGISGSEFKINDIEARKCFDSGMSPYYTFREHFSLNALES